MEKEEDNSIRLKSQIVAKGFMQVPGIDFTESFSPVTSNTTTRIIVTMTLFNDRWVCQSIDIEAAFLEGDVKEASFLEWPPAIVLLGLIDEETRKTICVKQLKCIYG